MHYFFHVYADGQCEQPIRETIHCLKESGLYDALTSFHIGFVGSHQKIEEALVCLNSLGVVFNVAARADKGFEQVTQTPMWNYSKDHDGLMLYTHTKGASDWSEVNIRWRRSMLYWNIVRWKEAHDILASGYASAYGCHWMRPTLNMPEHTQGNYMMAGTFYWLRCDVLRDFPAPALTHRHEAEGFIGYGWHKKPFPVYDPTPYFPNSAPFADQWVNHPDGIKSMPEYHPHKHYPI
jgi:hypothetical protein